MNESRFIKPWLANWSGGLRVVLFLILLSSIMEFASIALNQNYVLSYLGAQPEDTTLGLQLTYAAIITTLPIQFRFLRYFQTRNYVLTLTFVSIVLNIASIFNTDITVFFFIRFVQGCIVACLSGSMLTIIPTFLGPEKARPIGSTIFYGTVLSCIVLMGFIASFITVNSDFINLYYYLIAYQVLVLILVLAAFKVQSIVHKYPLYQIDWVGTVFFVMGSVGLAYALIYGSKYYWFTDVRIQFSALITVTGTILYLIRQSLVKRPLINLSVFRYKKFWLGLILLGLFYGSKESIEIVYEYTSYALRWSSTREMTLGLCNIAGLITFMIVTAQILLRKKGATIYFMIVGFSLSLIYHLWMYFLFTTDLAFSDLLLPVFFQGAASGILFVPLMIFTLTSVPLSTGSSGLVIAAFTRFSSLLNANAGFYNLNLYFNQLYKESFLFHLTIVDDAASENLDSLNQFYLSKGLSPDQAADAANDALSKTLELHGQLLANRAVFLVIGCLIAVLLLLTLMTLTVQTIKSLFENRKNAIADENIEINKMAL